MQIYTATATNGAKISKNSKLSFSHAIVYLEPDGVIHRAAWASSQQNALKVAAAMRKQAAVRGCVVAGFAVEICKAEAA